ncbi:MAG: hypothetical protein Q8J68_00495 [Methanolobus sp.]|uniref:hypothetical protein n=1 Tax=Methanolobus sp. TaxID=1874737 RepID=UPI002731E0CA|nr:hypothetical protein [Methanolobus sp.]MDP2215761.1 hypothetical protein [Methanolobus sp.]
MTNNTSQNKELSAWARQFTQERKASIDYFLKHGSPIEKALVGKVVELAEATV